MQHRLFREANGVHSAKTPLDCGCEMWKNNFNCNFDEKSKRRMVAAMKLWSRNYNFLFGFGSFCALFCYSWQRPAFSLSIAIFFDAPWRRKYEFSRDWRLLCVIFYFPSSPAACRFCLPLMRSFISDRKTIRILEDPRLKAFVYKITNFPSILLLVGCGRVARMLRKKKKLNPFILFIFVVI